MSDARKICAYTGREGRPRPRRTDGAQRLIRFAALTAALAAGGCWWHESDVPAIEAADRARRSPLEDGTYCGVDAEGDSLQLEDDCARYAWRAGERRVQVTEIDEQPGAGEPGGKTEAERVWLDVAPLSHGLVLMQYEETGESDEAQGAREGARRSYNLFAVLPAREGYVTIPLPPPAVRDALAAEEGVTIEPSDPDDPNDYGRILAGKPAALRRLVERSAVAWLKAPPRPGVDKLSPNDASTDDAPVPPRYEVRLEAFRTGLDRQAVAEQGVAALRKRLERAMEKVD